jgi:N-formylglutamate deformylase
MLKNSVRAYKVFQPETPLPLIFDSPHSGRIYPDDFDFACSFEELRRAEDNHVDELYSCVTAYGGTLLCALFPRSYIDANRSKTDMDLTLLKGEWPGPVDDTGRSHAGIGIIRRLVKPGVPVYDRSLSVEEVEARIKTYYEPYHAALKKILDDAHYKFGRVWHINCHSMPSMPDGSLSDFVIGDRNGTSCDPDFSQALQIFLQGLGYRVALNKPYKGMELIRRYSAPDAGRHSVQIEVNKALYWDELTLAETKRSAALKSDIEKMAIFCADYVQERLLNLAAD